MFLFFLSSFSLTATSLPLRDSLLLNRMPTELHALEVSPPFSLSLIPCNSGRWKRALLCSAGHQRLLYAKTVSAWAGCQTLKSLASLPDTTGICMPPALHPSAPSLPCYRYHRVLPEECHNHVKC